MPFLACRPAAIAMAATLACLGAPHPVHAQAALASPAATLPDVTVSASPLGTRADDMATPVTVVESEDLRARPNATLGEALDGQPGIHATHFGAGASRPVIRGMDGPRVRVLSDGSEVMDASTVSHDHAVTVEPALAQRIEVLRGPSAIAYGGDAIGGVVNVVDGKIPTAIPANGHEGSVDLLGSTGAREKQGAFSLTGGAGNIAVHAEGLARNAGDYRVGSGWPDGSRVAGSDSRTRTGSLGLSWIGERGYLGAAYTRQRNDYGLPGHSHALEECEVHASGAPHFHCGGGHEDEDHGHDHDHDHGHEEHGHEEHGHGEDEHGVPVVKLRSNRWDVRGEYRDPLPGFTRARLRGGYTDYQHQEIEEGEVATTFKNKAYDGRLELEHRPVAGLRGAVGLQGSRRDFSAVGEEAYVLPSVTRRAGLFLLEEYRLGDWRFEAGARHDRQRIRIEGGQPDRSHHGTSVSLGATWRFLPAYALGLALSRTQRLPTAEELYANGPHMASGTWELGNPDLKRETAQNVDLTLRKTTGATTFSVGAFYNRVSDYIYARTLDQHEGALLIDYAQRDATFRGVEAQVRQQLTPVFGATAFGDLVRGKLSGGENLPRVPAARLGGRLDASWRQWRGELEFYRVFKQDRTAEHEAQTGGYNILNLGASYAGRQPGYGYEFYVRGSNLTNQLAYVHTSFIKNAAPLAGRSLTAGVRVAF